MILQHLKFSIITSFLLVIISCSDSPRPDYVNDPSEVGFNVSKLKSAVDNAVDLNNIYSLLIYKEDKLIVENYYNGKNKTQHLHLRSITKSITSILVGIAIEKGFIPSTETPISSYFPNYINSLNDQRWKKINIQHLLDMTSGLQWSESNEAINWYTKIEHPLDYIFNKPFNHEPGEYYNYNSAAVHLLSIIIKIATGLEEDKFADKYLFQHININSFEWERDYDGEIRGDAGLSLKPTDLLKIGQLFMKQGNWNSLEIISENWVHDSWKSKIKLNGSYGKIDNINYNNLWWSGEIKNEKVFFGLGYGGQLLFNFPDRNLIVLCNHEYQLSGNIASQQITTFINNVLFEIVKALD